MQYISYVTRVTLDLKWGPKFFLFHCYEGLKPSSRTGWFLSGLIILNKTIVQALVAILLSVIMHFIFHAFVSFLLGNPLGLAAKPLAAADIEDDLFDSTPGSLFATHEVLHDGTMNDVDLFATHASGLDDYCPTDVSLEDEEGGSWDLETLETRGLEERGLDLLVESSDLQCIKRGAGPNKPKKKDVVVPKAPSLWPLVYPELPNGQCPYPMRPLAVCCTGREGTNPFDCWPCM